MPEINFILPHWLYWGGLLGFPLLAMLAVAREKLKSEEGTSMSLVIAYVFWLFAGFAGIHRFYVRSLWGFVYIPLLLAVIYGNAEVRLARETMSDTRTVLRTATYEQERAQTAVTRGVAGAEQRLVAAKQTEAAAKAKMDAAVATHDFWDHLAGAFAAIIGVLLLIDAALLPRLFRQCREREEREGGPKFAPVEIPPTVHEQGTGEDPTLKIQSPAARVLDWTTEWSGRFVAWWTVLSIFVYYYEVVVRFLFNSPTNWTHESMFIMYGVQYLIAGAYAYKVDAHVRVDIFYIKLRDRGKAIADLLTSFFFFLFTSTMLATGFIYARDAMRLGEVSFTEWGIQYWPIKLAIPIGALLLIFQGLSKLLKDVQIVFGRRV